MSPADREILIESMRSERNPNPNPPDHAIRLLEETCERTGLSWKQRHVYLIQRGGKWQVTVSIDGFRLIANQDPEYAGQDGPLWCMAPDGAWTDIPPDKEPYACKVGAVRNKAGVLSTTWGVAKFKDYNPGMGLWKKFPSTMIAKCAEMLALRKALPGKLGGLYGVEEMDQAEQKTKPTVTGYAGHDGQQLTATTEPAKTRRAATKATASEQKSEPEQTQAVVNSGASWSEAIQEARTLEELKAVGQKILVAVSDKDERDTLNKVYTERKAKLLEEQK